MFTLTLNFWSSTLDKAPCGHCYLLKAQKIWNPFRRCHVGDWRAAPLCLQHSQCLSSVQGEKLFPHQPQIKGLACVGGASGHFFKWNHWVQQDVYALRDAWGLRPLPFLQGTVLCFSQAPISASLLGMSSANRAAGRISYTTCIVFFLFGPRWCHWIGIC